MTTLAALDDLLQRARAAHDAADTPAARALFRQAAELAPECAEAWLGLALAVPQLAERRDYLDRALALSPASPEARAARADVERLLAEGRLIAPAPRRPRAPTPGAPEPAPPEPAGTAAAACYRHPERETGLRCVSCDRPICAACSHQAPVGQLCPECRKRRRPVNYQVGPRELALGGLAGFLIMLLTGALYSFVGIGFFYFGLILGPLAGELVLRASDWLTRGKRGRAMQIGVGAAMGLAGLLAMFVPGLIAYTQLMATPGLAELLAETGEQISPLMMLYPDPWVLIFVGAAVVTTMYRLR